MLFNDGVYKHKSGFTLMVVDGKPMLSTDHKLAYRADEIFNPNNWEEVKNNGNKE